MKKKEKKKEERRIELMIIGFYILVGILLFVLISR